jgi:hypothetical protein
MWLLSDAHSRVRTRGGGKRDIELRVRLPASDDQAYSSLFTKLWHTPVEHPAETGSAEDKNIALAPDFCRSKNFLRRADSIGKRDKVIELCRLALCICMHVRAGQPHTDNMRRDYDGKCLVKEHPSNDCLNHTHRTTTVGTR